MWPLYFGKRSIVARHSFALGALIVCAAGTAARAQTTPPARGYREYLAILGTPIGSLPPLATYTILGAAQASPQVVARYGFISDITEPLAPATGGHAAHSLDSFGLTGILATGLGGTVSATAGLSNERCTGCTGSRFMGSIGGDYRILATPINNTGVRLNLSVNGELGFGNPVDGTAWTADLGIPLAFNIGERTGTSIIPFVTPSFAFLNASSDSLSTVHAGRLLIGGGVALFNAKSALGANLGFQYVFVSHTQVQIGVGLTYGGR